MPTTPVDAELLDVIGKEALITLAENFGGTRLYIPARIKPESEIVAAIGMIAAAKLSERFAPDVIRVPLARDLRAVRYRSQGYSNAKIAVKLGMTETGVNGLFARLVARGVAIGPCH